MDDTTDIVSLKDDTDELCVYCEDQAKLEVLGVLSLCETCAQDLAAKIIDHITG